MHAFALIVFGSLALTWIVAAASLARGVPRIPRLARVSPSSGGPLPRISILFAARDEAEKLPAALETLLALDYPDYEIIAVDDRSQDATPQILQAAAARDARLKIVRVASLPAGWLGKPHALQQAFQHSTGEWLVFTDADVHFAPRLLRRAMALAQQENWEHLTLMGRVEMFTIGEKIALTFFGFAFTLSVRPWRVSVPGSGSYLGVGAFQLIRRGAYERLGTHRRLAMEVIDDVKLGKLAKMAGVASGVAFAGNEVSVRWHAGVRNIILGTTKNFFAAAGFQAVRAAVQIAGLLLLCVLPFAALPFVRGWPLVFDAIAAGLALATQVGVSIEYEVSPLYAVTHPIGALIFAWMLARSALVTLRQGGIVWRGTFYPLEELKRGLV